MKTPKFRLIVTLHKLQNPGFKRGKLSAQIFRPPQEPFVFRFVSFSVLSLMSCIIQLILFCSLVLLSFLFPSCLILD